MHGAKPTLYYKVLDHITDSSSRPEQIDDDWARPCSPIYTRCYHRGLRGPPALLLHVCSNQIFVKHCLLLVRLHKVSVGQSLEMFAGVYRRL